MGEQLALDLGLPPIPRETVVSRSNEAAAAIVARWPAWPGPIVRLNGPEGSGKSHLAAAFVRDSGGTLVTGRDVARHDPLALAEQPVAVDDAGGADEAALFHLINAVRERGTGLLLTSRHTRPVGLADLASRLRAAADVALLPPDDALLRQVMIEAFAERQLAPRPEVIDFLLGRVERTLHGVMAIVAQMDQESLRTMRPPTRPLAAKVLELGLFG